MIKTIPRDIALKSAPFFAYTIVSLQDGKYNPDNAPYQPGEMIETPQGTSILTEQDCLKLNREAQHEFQRLSDKVDITDLKDKYVDELTYSLSGKTSLEIYFNQLHDIYSSIFKKLEITNLILMMDYAVPWLSALIEDPALKSIQSILIENQVEPTFCGALEVKSNNFRQLLPLLFWYGRYNDIFPEIHFSSEKSEITFNICPFGNLHFNCYHETALEQVKSILAQTDFKPITNDQCGLKYPEITA